MSYSVLLDNVLGDFPKRVLKQLHRTACVGWEEVVIEGGQTLLQNILIVLSCSWNILVKADKAVGSRTLLVQGLQANISLWCREVYVFSKLSR